jgi:hypothetical protein
VAGITKTLHLNVYKLFIVQHIMDADKVVRKEFCMQMFHPVQDDEIFLDFVIFIDESTFHASGKANTHGFRIWGSENPLVFLEYIRDSLHSDYFPENLVSPGIKPKPLDLYPGSLTTRLRRWSVCIYNHHNYGHCTSFFLLFKNTTFPRLSLKRRVLNKRQDDG